MRIRSKLALTFLLTVVLLTSLLTYVVISKTLEKSIQDFVYHSQEEMRLVDGNYQTLFDNITRDVNYLAQSELFAQVDVPLSNYMGDVARPTDASIAGGIEAGIERFFERYANSRPHLIDIYFGAADGGFVGVSDDPADNYDPRLRPWYSAAINTQADAAITEPYLNASLAAEPMVSVSTPVTGADGRLLGVLSADVTLSELTELVRSVQVGKSGYMLLLDEKGNILCDPSNADNLFRNVRDIDGTLYSKLASSDAESFESRGSERAKLVSQYVSTNSGWRFVTVIDIDEIFEKQWPMINSVLLTAALAAFVFVALGTYIAAKITSPIVHVTKNLQQIAEGGADLTRDLNVTSDDEIGDLATWFNRFLQSARDTQNETLRTQKLEAIGQLAAGIAHEINTPTQYVSDNVSFLSNAIDELLPILKGHLDLIEVPKDPVDYDASLEHHRKLAAEADLEYLLEEMPPALSQSRDGLSQVAKIVRAMKNFSHPGDEILPVDLNQSIESTVTVARNEWKFVADMELELDPSIPTVSCIPSAINQVLLNLIVNAAHAVGEKVSDAGAGKGTICVSTQAEDDVVAVTVADSGCGMTEETRERIFEHFFTTKEVGKGTGQGLSMAYDIVVKKHGGSFTVESEPGVGSSFTMRLPVEAAVGGATESAGNEDLRAATAA